MEDFLSGKIDAIACAYALAPLAIWTRAQDDSDLAVFERIRDECIELPVGTERAHWAHEALQREDKKIEEVRRRWTESARAAATRLSAKYEWAPQRRAELRRLGVTGPEV